MHGTVWYWNVELTEYCVNRLCLFIADVYFHGITYSGAQRDVGKYPKALYP